MVSPKIAGGCLISDSTASVEPLVNLTTKSKSKKSKETKSCAQSPSDATKSSKPHTKKSAKKVDDSAPESARSVLETLADSKRDEPQVVNAKKFKAKETKEKKNKADKKHRSADDNKVEERSEKLTNQVQIVDAVENASWMNSIFTVSIFRSFTLVRSFSASSFGSADRNSLLNTIFYIFVCYVLIIY